MKRNERRRAGRRVMAVALTAVGLLCVSGASASAATIAVNTTNDEFASGPRCSLREAVWAANNDSNAQAPGCSAGSGTDVIDLRAGNFSLQRAAATPAATNEDGGLYGDLDISSPLSIIHTGLQRATIDAVLFEERALHVLPGAGPVRLQGLTVNGGFGAPLGAGILNQSTLAIDASTIMDGRAGAGGGGIANLGGATVIRNSTMFGNSAVDDGGGIWVGGGAVNLRNVTVTSNRVFNGDGGGVFAFSSGGTSSIFLADTLLAGNFDDGGGEAHDCAKIGGSIVSQGQNLVGNTNGCGYQRRGGDIINRSAQVLGLDDLGGPTPTANLKKTSPAINAASGCLATDQRGVPRRLGRRCDIGAWELVRCRGVVVNRVGTNRAELLIGSGLADGFLALGGADTVRALGGRDGLCGGGGPDRLEGGGGPDRIDGGAGRDTCVPGRGGGNRLFSCEVRARLARFW